MSLLAVGAGFTFVFISVLVFHIRAADIPLITPFPLAALGLALSQVLALHRLLALTFGGWLL